MKNQPKNRDKKHNNRNSMPPSNYVCNKCHIAGHWISDCPTKYSQPRADYVCNICNIAGHWRKNCPCKNVLKLAQMSDEEIISTAKTYKMTSEGQEKFINICKIQQITRIRKIDNLLDEYYKSFNISDYKDKNGDGKFLKFCKENNLKLNKFGNELLGYSRLINEFLWQTGTGTYWFNDAVKGCIYLNWDDNFPIHHFPGVNICGSIRKGIMYKVMRQCYLEGYLPSNSAQETRKHLGLENHVGYHINSNHNCKHLRNGIECRYCLSRKLCHRYLLIGYMKRDDVEVRVENVPECIIELIVRFFEKKDAVTLLKELAIFLE